MRLSSPYFIPFFLSISLVRDSAKTYIDYTFVFNLLSKRKEAPSTDFHFMRQGATYSILPSYLGNYKYFLSNYMDWEYYYAN